MPPKKKTIGLRELRVGLLVIVSILVLIFLILNASGDIDVFGKELHLKARFANADGLRAGSEVRLAGVRIGKVDEVRLLPPTDNPADPKVEARMSINTVIDGKPATDLIRKDSSAQLGSPGLLGNEKLINIIPGTSVSEPVPEDFTLSSESSTTFQALTTSGNELVQQLNQLSKEFTGIAQKANEGQGTLGRFINDEAFYNNLNATIRDTQDVIRLIETGQGSAGRFLNDPALYNNVTAISAQLQGIAEDLRRGRGTAGRLLTDEALYDETRAVVSRFNRSVDELNIIIADLRQGRGTAGKLLTDDAIYNDARAAIARFNTAAERIDNVVAGIQRGEGTAGKLLTDEQLYNNVNQLSAESVKLIYDFRQNPKKYLTIKFELF
ncbi:MAG TPA: MlaD family protein [Pyrinomonadaceae bacterium]|jgi:phospholipid/cholesterol/gamma-HCH transport system substrate-binding protein